MSPAGTQFVGVQVDVTSKTEGTAVGDKSGVPLLVKYDTRLRDANKNMVNEINTTVQVLCLLIRMLSVHALRSACS